MSEVPSNLVFYIGCSLFTVTLIAVNLSRNGYNFYIGDYFNEISDYLNGTQEIVNIEEGNSHYNNISSQFDTNTCYLKET